MNLLEAFDDVTRKTAELNRTQLLAGRPLLHEEDWSSGTRAGELQTRLSYLMLAPSQDVLDALIAHAVAWKRKLAEAEEVSVTSGEAA